MNAPMQITSSNKRSQLYRVAVNKSRFDKAEFGDHASRTEMAYDNQVAGSSKPSAMKLHFVERIKELIEAHMEDGTYGIEQLSRDAGASRSQIHNKLKKWTGLSTSHFIRLIKLQRAKYLLVQSDLNITQVAYEVGFNDPSYFSRVFDETFGICPRVFRNRWQQTAGMA